MSKVSSRARGAGANFVLINRAQPRCVFQILAAEEDISRLKATSCAKVNCHLLEAIQAVNRIYEGSADLSKAIEFKNAAVAAITAAMANLETVEQMFFCEIERWIKRI